MAELIFKGDGAVQVFGGPFFIGGDVGEEYRIICNGELVTLKFHHGCDIRKGANGLTNEALIAILVDRLKHKNAVVPSAENLHAIQNLEAAMMMLVTRKANREVREVAGTKEI